ncbi:hypothetical protein CLD22_01840 [Rubrivivax gelatinosus]|nr:hypothetical protein [Rubrivivax gelatinosus]
MSMERKLIRSEQIGDLTLNLYVYEEAVTARAVPLADLAAMQRTSGELLALVYEANTRLPDDLTIRAALGMARSLHNRLEGATR